MDIYCPICGEPWDIGELHDAGMPYAQAKREFFERGCRALGGTCGSHRLDDSLFGLYAEFGEDLDGLAADLEDLFL